MSVVYEVGKKMSVSVCVCLLKWFVIKLRKRCIGRRWSSVARFWSSSSFAVIILMKRVIWWILRVVVVRISVESIFNLVFLVMRLIWILVYLFLSVLD